MPVHIDEEIVGLFLLANAILQDVYVDRVELLHGWRRHIIFMKPHQVPQPDDDDLLRQMPSSSW